MSQYYSPYRNKNLFDPESDKPFTVSRSKIDLFLECPRCFYLDRKIGVARPPGFPFNLNKAVDSLLKKEFDFHRRQGSTHPLMKEYGIDAIPFNHENLDEWRDSLRRGIRFWHGPTNLMITGGIDDVWINPAGELHVVDYKATSKTSEVNLDSDWQIGYKRQVEIYQWLFRKNDFKVSDTAYFVYCNGNAEKEEFNAKLEFDIKVIPYVGNDDWVEKTIFEIQKCLTAGDLPKADKDCDYCRYHEALGEVENKNGIR